ncbi:Outer membrane receptor for ferrienterochelin and colicins [Sinomicrobium oceani]|uniref:Outer membrane receptor for ferrienterochelin and colicins n=1 Tax=Sinomicrobium oceani TaxID=1150368 RepID=A0A1K1PS41_9FLAO|nr:TonB-dependent receptor [Sinomicrobium oceani]SFW50472.1 Outer membrane receptor for ferrienterochelin and colicins [Sinomicrobium oceani]
MAHLSVQSLFWFILLTIFTVNIYAQAPLTIEISGTVTDRSGLPLAYANIVALRNTDNSPVTGTTSSEDGTFSVRITEKDFYLNISVIGFENRVLRDFAPETTTVNLGTIILDENREQLEEIVVSAERSSTEFRLDKRVFNIGKDISNTGVGALQVLNTIPSVTVNMEGRISLRGSQGVQILINGKPSVLTSGDSNALGTITSDRIDRIEVITNPSAKYDAEGTSGIINIILKKDEKQGMHGAVTLNTGIPDNHSIGLSMNRRTEKWNIFGQLGIGRRSFPQESDIRSHDLVNRTELYMNGAETHNEKFYQLNLGADFHPDKTSVITLSGRYALEKESGGSDFLYTLYEENTDALSSWKRDEDTEADNPKFEYELQYKKDFDKTGDHTLLLSALGSYFRKDQESLYRNTRVAGNYENTLQQMQTDYEMAEYTFKADYTLALATNAILEAGSQYVLTSVTNDYEVLETRNDTWVPDPDYTNIFEYRQHVLALYSTVAYEKDRWGVKLGLRMEATDLNTLLKNDQRKNDRKYHNFFPTVHTSLSISEQLSLQAGYSRRIKRPDLWELNPFYAIRNDYDVYVGNPDLDPEYTDAFEITAISKWQGVSFNLGAYYRYTTDVMETVMHFEENVTVVTPDNIGSSATTGIEANAKYNLSDRASLHWDLNYNYLERNGSFQDRSFDFNTTQWQTRLLSKFRIPGGLDLELTGNYESGFRNVQYRMREKCYMDAGLRKKIFKGRLVMNLSVRDVFASKRFSPVTITDSYTLLKEERNGRFVTFGLSFGFGKGDAMEYSAQKQF